MPRISARLDVGRREVLSSAGLIVAGGSMLQARAGGIDLPAVPKADLTPGLPISRVIKGAWQLSGGHRSVQRVCGVPEMSMPCPHSSPHVNRDLCAVLSKSFIS